MSYFLTDSDAAKIRHVVRTVTEHTDPAPVVTRRRLIPVDPPAGHPFDAELVNQGTDEEPQFAVKVFNSALPDSPYAGIVYIGDWTFSVPVDELEISDDRGFFVDLVVTYVPGGNTPFSLGFELRQYGAVVQDNYTTFRQTIAEGKLPDVVSRQKTDITVEGRWI